MGAMVDEKRGDVTEPTAGAQAPRANCNGMPLGDVAKHYGGQWMSSTGEPIALIKDGKMVGSLGTTVTLNFISERSCSFELSGVTHTGQFREDAGRQTLSWSHGEVWSRILPECGRVEVRGPATRPAHSAKLPVRPTHAAKLPARCVPEEDEAKRRAFEVAKASSDAGMERARKAFEQEKARKAAARDRLQKLQNEKPRG